jgi:prepilin-type N-terminal cleavage/methylation domain-containing protein
MKRGFTLIELLVVIGIIVILMAAAIVAINPFRQFAMANNAARWSGVTTIQNAISQRIVDNKGRYNVCPAGATVTDCPATGDTAPTGTNVCMGTGTLAATVVTGICDSYYDIDPCIVSGTPSYVGALPVDPQNGKYESSTNYNTRYQIHCDAATGRITISAPDAQLGETISITR